MKLEKEGPDVKISQPDPETIEVVEGHGSGRAFGVIVLLGGGFLVWRSSGEITDMTFLFGVLLAVFGGAVATQRYVMTLNRLSGTWSCGGDVFFVISFQSRGALAALGPVHISRFASNPRTDNMGEAIITYPVTIAARSMKGAEEELRFGQHWSLEEARSISAGLAEFLHKPVLDESDKEQEGTELQ